MNQKYTHLFFDLDHTLWDFDKNSSETLTELFHRYSLENLLTTTVESFLQNHTLINADLWHLYNQHKIDKSELRTQRFKLLFHRFNFNDDSLAETLDQEYIHLCPEKTHLIKGTITTLDYLVNKNYSLHIITNGFHETQFRKLKACNLLDYFNTVTTSECSGYNKPDRKMFSYALNKAFTSYKNSLIIGDNLKTDIQGAKNVGMDQVFFNESKKRHQFKVTHEISELDQLKRIL